MTLALTKEKWPIENAGPILGGASFPAANLRLAVPLANGARGLARNWCSI
jgi:hypothetical protein